MIKKKKSKAKKKVNKKIKKRLSKGIKKNKVNKRKTKSLKKAKEKKKVSTKKTRLVAPTLLEGEIVGAVTHYFGKVKAGVIKMSGSLAIGDNILIKGHTTNFKQKVSSLQINNQPVEKVGPNDEAGILVEKRVRQHDTVYKI